MKKALSKILQNNAFKYAGIALLSTAAFLSASKVYNHINPKVNINGQSMTPNIMPGLTYQGQRSIIGGSIERNQIVAILPHGLESKDVLHPNGPYIKRVVGMPGDILVFSPIEGNLIKINGVDVTLEATSAYPTFTLTSKREDSLGSKIKERPYSLTDGHGGSYLVYQAFLAGNELKKSPDLKSFSEVVFNMPFLNERKVDAQPVTVEVPNGYYFALSDNRAAGTDSRHFGFVPKDAMFGFTRLEPIQKQDS
jgi:signal peptidase I